MHWRWIGTRCLQKPHKWLQAARETHTAAETPFASNQRIYWYPGHMAKAFRLLQDKYLRDAHVLMEVRDARLPTSSANARFERLAQRWALGAGGAAAPRARVLVFNKADLVSPRDRAALTLEPNPNPTPITTFATHAAAPPAAPLGVGRLLRYLKRLARAREDSVGAPVAAGGLRLVVAGLPNAGKSSLVNALRHAGIRRGKVASVAPTPGHTRAFGTPVAVCDNPRIVLVDAPGILDPASHSDPEVGLRLALATATNDRLVHGEVLADYLVHRLNQRDDLCAGYRARYRVPTDSVVTCSSHLLPYIAARFAMLKSGGVPDEERALKRLFLDYRTGALGLWSLDEAPRPLSQATLPLIQETQPR